MVIRWQTASELDTLGFAVYREESGRRVRLTRRLIAAGGFGRSSGHRYSFADRHQGHSATRYWVEAVALDGSRSWLGPVAPR